MVSEVLRHETIVWLAMMSRVRHWTDHDQCHRESRQRDACGLRRHPRVLFGNDEAAMEYSCDVPPEGLMESGMSHLFEGT